MAEKQGSVGKRQKIAQSNKVMFFWIAGMSAVVGACAVVAWFLLQQLVFHTKIAAEADNTVAVIKENQKSVEKLRENVRLLEVNQALNTSKAESDERALQVILDALPADDNNLALGASLQQRLIGEVDGVKIESLVVGSQSDEVVTEEGAFTEMADVQSVPFTVVMEAGDVNLLKDVVARFERSIRTIDIDNFNLEKNDNNYRLTLNARAYYKPAVEVKLEDKKVTQ